MPFFEEFLVAFLFGSVLFITETDFAL